MDEQVPCIVLLGNYPVAKEFPSFKEAKAWIRLHTEIFRKSFPYSEYPVKIYFFITKLEMKADNV